MKFPVRDAALFNHPGIPLLRLGGVFIDKNLGRATVRAVLQHDCTFFRLHDVSQKNWHTSLSTYVCVRARRDSQSYIHQTSFARLVPELLLERGTVSSCVVAYVNIQYFLYFGRNEHVLSSYEAVATNGLEDMAKLGHFWLRLLATLLACAAPFQTIPLAAEQVRVRHMEGLMHGFLALRTLDGKRLADGEMTQVAEGDRVTSRLIFRFKDGSVYDDTTIFSQRGAFRLLSSHGPVAHPLR